MSKPKVRNDVFLFVSISGKLASSTSLGPRVSLKFHFKTSWVISRTLVAELLAYPRDFGKLSPRDQFQIPAIQIQVHGFQFQRHGKTTVPRDSNDTGTPSTDTRHTARRTKTEEVPHTSTRPQTSSSQVHKTTISREFQTV